MLSAEHFKRPRGLFETLKTDSRVVCTDVQDDANDVWFHKNKIALGLEGQIWE